MQASKQGEQRPLFPGNDLSKTYLDEPPRPGWTIGFDGGYAPPRPRPYRGEVNQMWADHDPHAGYHRDWENGDGNWETGTVAELIFEFDTPEAAIEFDADAMRNVCGMVLEVFEVEGVPGGIGITQDKFFDDAPMTDWVSWIRGPRLYRIEWSREGMSDHREIVSRAAKAFPRSP